MSRICQITNKTVISGNNVSHAVNRTKRKFLPNLQISRMNSEGLGRMVKLRTSTSAIRTIDFKGGLDEYLLTTPNRKLSADAKKLKRKLLKNKASA